MLVSTNWLKQYVDIDHVSTEQLAEDITKTGVEVEQVFEPTLVSDDLVVGYVTACDQHPNADKLNLCQVDVGNGEIAQIVCGADNVASGQHVVVAKPGAVLPGGFKIKKTKLRGESSEGMICSLQELGIDEKYIADDYKEGIYVFNESVEAGQLAAPLLNLDDAIIEFDVTPNRSDCLSILGMAYEVAAMYDHEIELPNSEVDQAQEQSSDYVDVTIANEEANPYYGAWVIKDLTVTTSPLWLQNRLISAGIRPINNVVDVTNFILLEYGQPLHAFDYDRFGSNQVLTRLALEGETIQTLDGEERTLSSHHLVITNGEEPHAIAGVMGGEKSEVQDDTTTVLLEAAYFDPQTIRQSSKDHGIRSEASVRYEKGLDITRVKEAASRAAQLLASLGGGQVLGDIVEAGSTSWTPYVISFTKTEMVKRIGADISLEEMTQIIERLQFDYEVDGETITVTAPPRRHDIVIKEDMLEEIARLYGYDNIPFTLPIGEMDQGGLTSKQKQLRAVHDYLQASGLYESVTYSLTTETKAQHFISPDVRELNVSPVKLAMPMSDLHSHLRLSAVPELLSSLQYNVARNQYNVGLYELGSIYTQTEGEGTQPNERLRLAAAVTGVWKNHPWQGVQKSVDFFVLKGILEGLFDYLAIDGIEFKQGEIDDLHPGRTALIELNKTVIGYVGQVHPTVQKEHDLQETYVFDVNLDALLDVTNTQAGYKPITKYPAIAQDLAFVVDQSTPAAELAEAIKEKGQPHLESVRVFDVYEGEHMETGKKSVAFNLIFQHQERTLTDEEIDQARTNIVEHLQAEYNAILRG
ncbi:phenylalanine--tRNA ligase subunit beta [Alkalibacillus salilacus]|uniref:Phenylalanine--tRNA ligase beta subunit n=1 Tax=Alkalibacillus salilacus TaxID=284582 RepID=A0ABT9VGY4_9BACI|nr:phenylalanine--tRNA ligase subunit beta [Alkalibacillus salilacus]MDQ0160224.1 phenylalanyl-tRNA synthetase beta chain [Alkalibacillus salilacus]